MALIDQVKKNWASVLVIAGIIGGTYYAIDVIDARASEVAKKEVQATVNKEMIDGAKKAAADAVKEQLPAIAKEVAAEVAKQVVEAQRAEAARRPNP